MIDLSRARIVPYAHQVVGTSFIVTQPAVGLWDEMGAGKTKQTIDAAQILFTQGTIDRVVVLAPASVRAVWFDQELGELAKHLWDDLPSLVQEYHSRMRTWLWGEIGHPGGPQERLSWMISNYEFIRSEGRLKDLLKHCTPKTLLVLDESSAIKSNKAEQTKACFELRKKVGRIVLLNGTPIANNPMDLFTQGNILDPNILNCKFKTHFQARYAVMGGYAVHGRPVQIVGWRDIPDLQRRFAPYVLRRLKTECMDLPAKIPSVVWPTPLTQTTWKIYQEMREEMVVWLTDQTVSVASQAMTKAIRLSQVCSGFLGGVEAEIQEPDGEMPEWMKDEFNALDLPERVQQDVGIRSEFDPNVQEIGREKLDVFLERLSMLLEEDQNLKLLAWTRFRPELDRVYRELQKEKGLQLGRIWGGQKRHEREHALRLLDPRTAPRGPAVVLGTPSSGSMGLNLAACHTVIYISNDYSLKTRLQSEDRVHRPGQTHPVSYFDIVATGPNGQKTIDHTVVKTLRDKGDLATLTTSAWLSVLRDE